MSEIQIPEFLETPENAWIKCESHKILPSTEIACTVLRYNGEQRVVIEAAEFVDTTVPRLMAMVIANVGSAKLVSFPSGDRITVNVEVIQSNNGSSIGS